MSTNITTPYYDRPDAELVQWGNRLLEILGPAPTNWGLNSTMITELTAANDDWVTAYEIATNPATRTHLACEAKANARQAFLGQVKNAVGIINSTPSVTDVMKGQIDIPIRKPRQKREVVNVKPGLSIVSRDGTTVVLRITAPGTARRSKPKTCECTFIYYLIGETPSTNPDDWVFAGAHKVALCPVPLPSDLPAGTKVHFTAQYYNTAGTGPSSPILSTVIAGGGGAFGATELKNAA